MYGKRTVKLFQRKNNSNSNRSRSPPKSRSTKMSNAQKAFNNREKQRRLNQMRRNRLRQMFPNNFSNSNNNNNLNMFGVNLGNRYFKVGNNKISLHSMKGALLLPTHQAKVSKEFNHLLNWWKSQNAKNYFKNQNIFEHPITKRRHRYNNFLIVN